MKIKYSILVVLLLSFSIKPLFTQTTFKLDPRATTYIDKAQLECIYQYSINAPLKDSTNIKKLETYTTILQASSTTSKFWDWNSFKKDSITYFSTPAITTDSINKLSWKYNMKVRNLFVPVIVKNYPNGKITVTDEVAPDDYVYTEDKTENKWELKDDTLTVCGYLCNKAVCSFGGREWTAWYAPDIILSDGPWKLYGLPGLILKAQDSTATHCFEAISIRKSERPIYLAKNDFLIKAKKEQFIKTRSKFEEDPQKYLLVRSFKSITVLKDVDVLLIDGRRAKIFNKTIYCPLELK